MISEIETVKNRAERLGYRFSIRLNNTSDISPESFYIRRDGKQINILNRGVKFLKELSSQKNIPITISLSLIVVITWKRVNKC